MTKTIGLLLISAITAGSFSLVEAEPLDLPTALERAYTNSPLLEIAQAEVGAKSGLTTQARLWSNPDFMVDAEDFGGSKGYTGWKQAQVTYSFSQDFELWGKRSNRTALAAYEEGAAEWDLTLTWLNLRANVTRTFIHAAILQEKCRLAQQMLAMTNDMLETIRTKVESGKIALIGLHREEITVTRARLGLARLEADLRSAYQQLATYWGSAYPDFTEVIYPLSEITSPCSLCDLLCTIDSHPELARMDDQVAAAYEALRLEEKVPLPDVSVSGGFRQYPGQGAYGFVAAFDITLPVWNQNQGNISRARHELSAAISRRESARIDLERRLSTTHRELVALYRETKALDDVILRSSEQTLDLTKEGYEGGKFAYIELLDARRTYFELREQYLDTLLLYHQKRADLDQLIADGEE